MSEEKRPGGYFENRERVVFLREERKTSLKPEDRDRLAEIIRDKSYVDKGFFPLASGKTSTYYFNMKNTFCDQEGIYLITRWLLEKVVETQATAIGGMELGAVYPVATTILKLHEEGRKIRSFTVRKKAKEHGTKNKIEGDIRLGDIAIIIDDVITTGGSVLEAIHAVEEIGAKVLKVLCLVDREDEKKLELENYSIEALFTTTDFKSMPKKGAEKSDEGENPRAKAGG